MLPKHAPSRRRLASKVGKKISQKMGLHGMVFNYLKQNIGTVPYHEPNFHHDGQRTMTDMEAFLNLVKCTFGTGVLAMPRAFYNAGWLLGLISTVLFAIFLVYAMHVLLNDISCLSKRYNIPMLSYSDAMYLAVLNGPPWVRPLSRYFQIQVDIFLCTYHFGVDCVYVVFISKCLKQLGDIYLAPIDQRIYMALMTVPLILIFLIRDMKSLVPFAIVSNLLLAIGICLILSYLVQDFPSLAERKAIQNLTHYPLVFGTVMFSIEGVGVILALQLNMKTPEHYLGRCGVLNRAMCIVIVFYVLFGFLGYWKFGDRTNSSILYNLPINETLPQCIIGIFAVAIFFSYALQGFVAIEIIWGIYMTPRLTENATKSIEYLVRMAVVIASVLCAIAYPDFGMLLSLVGAFCLAQLGLIFPGLINICVCYCEGYGPCKILLLRALFYIALGMCAGITGTMVSLVSLKEIFGDRILFFLRSLYIIN